MWVGAELWIYIAWTYPQRIESKGGRQRAELGPKAHFDCCGLFCCPCSAHGPTALNRDRTVQKLGATFLGLWLDPTEGQLVKAKAEWTRLVAECNQLKTRMTGNRGLLHGGRMVTRLHASPRLVSRRTKRRFAHTHTTARHPALARAHGLFAL